MSSIIYCPYCHWKCTSPTFRENNDLMASHVIEIHGIDKLEALVIKGLPSLVTAMKEFTPAMAAQLTDRVRRLFEFDVKVGTTCICGATLGGNPDRCYLCREYKHAIRLA